MAYNKPLPVITASDKDFWDGAKRHEFMLYHCTNCGAYYYPAVHCVSCDSPQMEWTRTSGKGTVVTFIVYHMAYHPSWKDDIPYNVAWVELREGPIFMTNIVSCKNEDIRVGMPVEVIFDDVTEEVTLPKFKPAG
jgi:uncharacterized OB-fold protein